MLSRRLRGVATSVTRRPKLPFTKTTSPRATILSPTRRLDRVCDMTVQLDDVPGAKIEDLAQWQLATSEAQCSLKFHIQQELHSRSDSGNWLRIRGIGGRTGRARRNIGNIGLRCRFAGSRFIANENCPGACGRLQLKGSCRSGLSPQLPATRPALHLRPALGSMLSGGRIGHFAQQFAPCLPFGPSLRPAAASGQCLHREER